ncbi:MAG: hypothetical protein IT379_04435 [Deltaproteobacteria bacterium]|nr:hypothetical protein [Deltaproteobacteria bacterium]
MRRTTKLSVLLGASILVCAVSLACGRSESTPTPPATPAPPTVATPTPPTTPTTPTTPTPPATPTPPTPTKAPEETFAQKVAKSRPLTPTTAPQVALGRQIRAVRCTMPGVELLSDSSFDSIGRIEMGTDGKLYALDADHRIMRFDVAGEGDTCTLTLDQTFGTAGRLNPGRDIKEIAAVAGNRIIASNGIFNSYRLTNGAVDIDCSGGGGYLAASADGRLAIGHFANSALKRVTWTDTLCQVEEWSAFRSPFTNVNTVSFVGRDIAIGGVLDTPADSDPRVVIVFDQNGRERYRAGNTAEGFGDDRFGWVHAIEQCGPNLCVVDSNFRRLSVWNPRGEFQGAVRLGDLLGLDYPWIPDLEMVRNVAYVPATQQRERTGVYEGAIYRVFGLVP